LPGCDAGCGADVSVGELRIVCAGLVLADDPGDPAAAELAAVVVEEHWVVVVAGTVEAMFGQVSGQDRCGVGH